MVYSLFINAVILLITTFNAALQINVTLFIAYLLFITSPVLNCQQIEI